ncbi:hypothetical protein EIP86_000120 [Pleurotus ostreatoroseus]|nr:hypothetical protein EIP86_000120 [Pleurotus ostreatoroseus]
MLRSIIAIANVMGITQMNLPVKDLLSRMTPVLRNRYEKVQEDTIHVIGRIGTHLSYTDTTASLSPSRKAPSASEFCPTLHARLPRRIRRHPDPLQRRRVRERSAGAGSSAREEQGGIVRAKPGPAQASKEWRHRIARRAAKEINDRFYMNLGIGVPTLVPEYLPPNVVLWSESEKGILRMGPYPAKERVDADIVNAGKETCTLLLGASMFDPVVSSFEQLTLVDLFGYTAKRLGPQDVLHILLLNVRVQERQSRLRNSVAIAIAIAAEPCRRE